MQMRRANSRTTESQRGSMLRAGVRALLLALGLAAPLLLLWLAATPLALRAMPVAIVPQPSEAPLPAQVQAQPAAPMPAPLQQETTLSMRVTQQNGGCETATDSVVAARGSILYFCYRLTNNSNMTLTRHIIADSTATRVRAAFTYTLAPGDSINLWNPPLSRVISDTAEASETRIDTWAGIDTSDGRQVQASDSVLLTVVDPQVEAALTLSRDPAVCGTVMTMTVPIGTTNVYLCITLTNVGSVPLTSHQLTFASGVTGNTSFNRTLAPGATMRISSAEANAYTGLGNLTLPTVNATPVVVNLTARSREANGVEATTTASASAVGANGALTVNAAVRTNPIIRQNECPATGATSITVVRGTPVWYCVQLVNTGSVPLTLHHLTSITPTINITIEHDLRPGATLYITQSLVSALGPYTITRNVSQRFIVTSTNSSGHRIINNRDTSVTSAEPTATPTETSTNAPTLPPSTPTITPTPPPTDTPFPTPTPTDTPITPSPTWTRSFVLSGLETPTPQAQIAAAELVPTVDFHATAIAKATQDTQATLVASGVIEPAAPLSPLETPTVAPELEGLDPAQLAILQQSTLTAVAATFAAEMPTATPSWTPTRTPIPTATPTPLPTATSTQRPIVYPTPAPPPDAGTLFTQVLGSSFATTNFIFLVTGTLVFFGVLGALVAFGFLRNGRERFEVYEIEEAVDESGEFDVADDYAPKKGKGKSTKGADSWPSSLP